MYGSLPPFSTRVTPFTPYSRLEIISEASNVLERILFFLHQTVKKQHYLMTDRLNTLNFKNNPNGFKKYGAQMV